MLTLVWDLDKPFQQEQLSGLMKRHGAEERQTKALHEQKVWKYRGLSLTLYESTLVIQGDFDQSAKQLLKDLSSLPGLHLQSKYSRLLASFNPRQNSLMCPICMSQSMVFEGRVEGVKLVFQTECAHTVELDAPLMMYTFRVMPDLNILISRSMSRLLSLGYFTSFEIVIPEFLIDYVDRVKKERGGIAEELKEVRRLVSEGNTRLLFIPENIIRVPKDYANTQEDKVVLELADITNSILITGDKNLRERAALQRRPTIFVSSFKELAELIKKS
jgi:rRNA-processing protein FCF1